MYPPSRRTNRNGDGTMGLFDFLRKRKLTTDISFEPVPPRGCMTLESEKGLLEDPSAEDLTACLQHMIADPSDFITLTPAQAVDGIRYIQACRIPEGIDVELGLEKDGMIRLAAKTCGEEETIAIFRDFFTGKALPDRNEYSPMRFRK